MKSLKYFILVLGLSLGFSTGAMAVLPQLYIGGAVSEKNSTAEFNTPSDTKYKSSFNTTSYLLSLGIRPINLPIPIISNFRVEAQYLGALSGSNKDSQYGLVLYYDILRFIPFVNPYVGVGTQYATYKFNNVSDVNNKSKSLYTLHAGLTGKIPVLPLDVFLEYRYTTSGNASSNVGSYKVSSNDVMLGLRYYVL
ncbi:MAG: hypothetical protein LBQ34_03380 [Alphaproteobacteria bacterium]|jgi:opacity protein-like surface antigen|nr:hypothetical protein [Alphaproteobacteria bacterium]